MLRMFLLSFIAFAMLSGCATSTSVLTSVAPRPPSIQTAAFVPDHGNTPEMDENLKQQMAAQGIRITTLLPVGTKSTKLADLMVSYMDEWHWDVVNYISMLTVNLYDGETGAMLVSGRWKEADLHTFHNPNTLLNELLTEMISRLKRQPVKAN